MTRSTLTLSTTLKTAIATIGLASGLAMTTTAQADYPEQDIRLIIPYGPGGATDILFRLISQEAEKTLGESPQAEADYPRKKRQRETVATPFETGVTLSVFYL